MAILGNREVHQPGQGYEHDPLHAYTASFMNSLKTVVTEAVQDVFGDPRRAFNDANTKSIMKDFFLENCCDEELYKTTGDAAGLDSYLEGMENLFENDMEAVHEYAATIDYNPVIGMTFPVHKFILMNCMFDKCIPHDVAAQPKFTISMEKKYLVTPEGEEIDMFTQQDKMTPAMIGVNPFMTTDITIPEYETTDIIASTHKRINTNDNLSVETYISAVYVPVKLKAGDINPETKQPATADGTVNCWLPVNCRFQTGYGEYDRTVTYGVKYASRDDSGNPIIKNDVINAYMKNNKFGIMAASGGTVVSKVRIKSRIDPSNAMLTTCSVKWRTTTQLFEIPNATPINVPLAPEEIKDIQALYNVNQLTKVMSMINTVLGNYKDDMIKNELDLSYSEKLPATQKFAGTFDFEPRKGYYADHIEWRSKTFMDALDTYVQHMIQVWNDPNITVAIVGRAGLIRKITPTSYTYQSAPSLGPVDLDYVKTVVTSDKRVYTFMSSDKMRNNNNLIIILNPRNSQRIMYKVVDYQAYVSNEIRNVNLYTLPAVHAFERFMFLDYMPVQARIRILNPMGDKRITFTNADPIGTTATNDFTADDPEPDPEPTTPSGGSGSSGGTTPPTTGGGGNSSSGTGTGG